MRTNILGSVPEGVVAGRAYDAYRWMLVEDDGTLVGAALRTSPYPMLLSPMPVDAARAVGRHVREVDPGLSALLGPRAETRAFLEAGGWSARLFMEEHLRVLGTFVAPPHPAPGHARLAEEADLDLLVEWHEQFVIDARLAIPVTAERVRAIITDRVLWLWEDGGRPVAMAGHAPLVTTPGGTVARIGPVFTPAGLRGRGYGTAITAAVVDVLLPQSDAIMLFADAANPASNSVYQRLGFDVAGELVELALDPLA